ncbi:putative transposase [Nitrospirillum viridazoti Y2]|uniref:Transposase InsO family protein n=1 Tax=Nitrospirillum amazonense TaxID=28077 RepID=A0A560HK32_9PROT|nr:IS3 family transposase [Nitrospirillum amazonense]EGY02654.1 putative transposase [Nitrospirillum amazonense Y2]TWB46822.1 transposase InsO family protein [Nitrospirillum amazonense]
MGIARSTYYDVPVATDGDAMILDRMKAICAEFESYGYRRVGAELRHQGLVVNSKKVRRLMREHDLQPRRRRRFVATTDSDHDEPIFPNRAADMTLTGPDQLRVGDITYVAVAAGFVYVAVILDAWSRRVVGYAISRSIDTRLTVAALKAAIIARIPPAACVQHTDRGNPYDNAKAESFMKTLKVEAVYPMAYETFDDVVSRSAAFHRTGLQCPAPSFGAGLSQPYRIRGTTRPIAGQFRGLKLSTPRGALQAAEFFYAAYEHEDTGTPNPQSHRSISTLSNNPEAVNGSSSRNRISDARSGACKITSDPIVRSPSSETSIPPATARTPNFSVVK